MEKPEPIGDGTTQFGFDYAGLVRVQRCCDNGDKRPRFACIRVYGANGDMIEIDCTPRKTRVQIKRKTKR